MEYLLKQYISEDNLLSVLPFKLSSYHWEAEEPYRPETYANIGIVGDSLVACLKCYENNPKTEYSHRDDPIYNDSCLEFFVAPLNSHKEYINVECNSKGVFLSEFGDGKYNRRLVADLTEFSPCVESFFGSDANGSFWGVKIKITKGFISSLYNINENEINFDVVKLNFYKCGDGCEIQHYLAFSPVTTLPPGFHNPECFAIFKREN